MLPLQNETKYITPNVNNIVDDPINLTSIWL